MAGSAVPLDAVIVLLRLAIRFCGVLKRILRGSSVDLPRISGLLLSAIVVQLVAEPVREFVEQAEKGSAAWRRG